MAKKCHLRVVLLCKGSGADKNTYRPTKDASQWWGRRDALVRCVASFLFGPTNEQQSRELILLFDDDLSEMHMSYDPSRASLRCIPNERCIIEVWKSAASKPNTTIQFPNGMACSCQVDPTLQDDDRRDYSDSKDSHKPSPAQDSLPRGLESKRQVLEFLQKNCSIEFLRDKGLNSSTNVILRKTNKKALGEIWTAWRKSQQQQQLLQQKDSNSTNNDHQRIESIFLKIITLSGDSEGHHVVGTLHEKFQEFPCYHQLVQPTENDSPMTLTIFLGAVRDMLDHEYTALERACNTRKLPLVGIRFGNVPEFTSKILSILVFHHSNGILSFAVGRLISNATDNNKLEPAGDARGQSSHKTTAYHVICAVPLRSNDFINTIDIDKRTRVHWALVRAVVVVLWRSRIASTGNGTAQHRNFLYLVFDDGIHISLRDEEFVAMLATQHQAAPCEYQILEALVTLLKSQLTSPAEEHADDDQQAKKKKVKEIMKDIISTSDPPVEHVMCVCSNTTRNMVNNFYASSSDSSKTKQVGAMIAFFELRNDKTKVGATSNLNKVVMKVAIKRSIAVSQESIVNGGCMDDEACALVALQHFIHQDRLWRCTVATTEGTKRKRK